MPRFDEKKLSEWTAVMADRAASGLSAASFCRERGIPSWQYYYWRKRVDERGRGCDGSAFVALDFSVSESASGIWFDLGGGLRLVVERGFDGGELRRALEAASPVRSGPC